jgi:hypothetical protein
VEIVTVPLEAVPFPCGRKVPKMRIIENRSSVNFFDIDNLLYPFILSYKAQKFIPKMANSVKFTRKLT